MGTGHALANLKFFETVESVCTTIKQRLAQVLTGMDASNAAKIRSLHDRVIASSFSTGQPIAKAGTDLASFELTGPI